jgi:hypothetical protein
MFLLHFYKKRFSKGYMRLLARVIRPQVLAPVSAGEFIL